MTIIGTPQKSSGSVLSLDTFFIVLQKPSAIIEEEKIIAEIRSEILKKPPTSLSELKERLLYLIRVNDTEGDLSASVAYLYKTVLYVYTYGKGKMYIDRNSRFSKIVEGNNTSSGYVKPGDLLLLSIEPLTSAADDADYLLTVQIEEVPFHEEILPQKTKKISFPRFPVVQLQSFSLKRKQITYIFAGLLVVLFIWSVIFGVQRRANQDLQKEIEATKEKVTAQLSEASDLATLNTTRAQILIADAKTEVSTLKRKTDGKNGQISQLETYISEQENKIFKREDKKYDEFYDLSLISSQAKGTKISVDGDTISVLNASKGEVYFISITKKSKNTITSDVIKGSTFISISENAVAGYKEGSGIYKATSSKVENVIKADSDWGKIGAIALFNGNIYLVDSQKNTIYKYLPTEKGYSDKTSYLKEAGADFSTVNSFMIDSSVYVATSQTVYKYISGVKDSFSLSIPHAFTIDTFITSGDLNKLYVLDKKAGIVYILSKDGQYERQINSSIFSKADDMAVSETEKSIYILSQNKIYSISLN